MPQRNWESPPDTSPRLCWLQEIPPGAQGTLPCTHTLTMSRAVKMFPQVKSQLNVFPVLIAFSLSVPGSCPLSACRQCPQPCWAGRGAAPQQKCLFEAFLCSSWELPLCQDCRPSEQHRHSTRTLMTLSGILCCLHQAQSLRECSEKFLKTLN